MPKTPLHSVPKSHRHSKSMNKMTLNEPAVIKLSENIKTESYVSGKGGVRSKAKANNNGISHKNVLASKEG